MLEVGNGMSGSEDRAHFSMWCMLAAPLISGNDLANMAPETLTILDNKDVIAVDQDKLGVEGFPYTTNGTVEIWFKPLTHGDWAMCALNRGKESQTITFDLEKRKRHRRALQARRTFFNENLLAAKSLDRANGGHHQGTSDGSNSRPRRAHAAT